MPSFKIAGKTKKDLAVVAQVAGLLSADELSGMTRAQIVNVLQEANKKADAAKAVESSGAESSTVESASAGSRKKPAKAAVRREVEKTSDRSGTVKTTRVRSARKAAEQIENESADLEKSKETEKKQNRSAASTRRKKSKDTAADTVSDSTDGEKKANPASRRKRNSVSKTETDGKTASEEQTGQTKAEKPAANITPSTRTKRRTSSRRKTDTARVDQEDAAPKAPEAKRDADIESDNKNANNNQNANESAARGNDSIPASEKKANPSDNDQQIIKFRPKVPPAATAAASVTAAPEESSPEAATAASEQPAKTEHDSRRVERQPDQRQTDNRPAETAVQQTVQPAGRVVPTAADTVKPRRPQVETGELQAGVLEIMPDGYGFLRKDNYLQGSKDIYVPPQYIRRFSLRPGDFVVGPVKLQRETDRYQALLYIKEVNGMAPEKMLRRPHFDRLTPIYPDQRYILESGRNELSTRIIDLVAPIGKGQRGMIVSPPKAGKTILLQKIANAISLNNPEAKLIVLLIDERPEEVTDMQRTINGEVVYSTFDKTPENHTKVVELVLERAMRLVELQQDVVILLDSMTRLARAYNLTINPTGRTLSGGLDPGALYGPKRFFGAARNIENGGSLTIIATSLIETGSRMDEVIFEEFKGTGNMEVYLDRKLSEKRIFPAIDINKSGTRREELLLSNKELDAVWTIRKAFSQLDTSSVTEAIINLLMKTQNNEHFIASVNVSLNDKNVFDAMRGNRPSAQGQTGTGGGYKNGGYSSQNSGYR